MLTVRRIYLYLVSAISLIAITWAVIGLARLIITEGIGQGQITGLASLLAIIIVGLPIYLFHWLMAQRSIQSSQAEFVSPIRQVYFYGIMAAGAAPIIGNMYRLLDNVLVALLGGTQPSYYPYDLTTGEHIAAILVWAVVWLYTWRLARPLANRQDSTHLAINLSIRRLYLLIFSLGGLALTTWGAIGLMRTLMELSSLVPWRTPIANFSAQLLVGGAGWVGYWFILQRDFAGGHPAEERSVLRKIYLYLAVFVYTVMTLSSGSLLLKRFIELALGAPPSGEPLLVQLGIPVPLLVVGLVLWVYHWRVVKQDAVQAPEGPRQATVRRIYAYLVAALGLITLLTGVIGLLIQLIDLLTSPVDVGFNTYREEIALLTAMIIVGLPVWLLPWRNMQRLAVRAFQGTEADSTAGVEERRAIIRKIYLYFFVFIASLGIFGSAGWFVFHILTALLGADLPDDFFTLVLDALVIALVSVGVWLYHWGAIRHDVQLEAQEQRQRLSDIVVVVIDGEAGELGQQIAGEIVDDLPDVQIKSLGLTPAAIEAMAGQPFSVTGLETAHYIIGSWQTLTTAPVAAAMADSAATKFVVPLTNEQWIWSGVRPQSPKGYAQQTVKGLKQAIDGDEVDFGSGMDTSTIIGIVVGLILFLCIGGSVVSGILSLLG